MSQAEEESREGGIDSSEFQEFVQESFSPVTFVGNALSNRNVRQAIVTVERALAQSKKAVELELYKNQDILISKINKLDKSENDVSGIMAASASLLQQVEKIERLVGLPFSRAKGSILKVETIHKSLGVIRDIICLERYVSRLKQVFPYGSDSAIPESAGYFPGDRGNISAEEEGICDLCETAKSAQRLLDSSVLSHVSVTRQQAIYVNQCLSRLDWTIRRKLLDLLSARSQVDIGNMLLGAYYLDTLEATLDYVTQELISKVSQKIREMFFLDQSDTTLAENMTKKDLWKRFLSVKELILEVHRSILLLEGILWRKYPWDSHKPLAAFVVSKSLGQVSAERHLEDISHHFLTRRLCFVIRDTLKSQVEATSTSARGSSRAKLFDMLVDLYPNIWQLLKSMEDSLYEQLSDDDMYDSFISLAFNLGNSNLFSTKYGSFDLVSTFYSCEAHYFAKSFSRLSFPLEQLFENPESSFDEDAVGGFIKLIEAEFLSNLELVESPNLLVKNLGSIIDMFVAKAEQSMNKVIGEEWNPTQSIFMDKLLSLSSFYNGILLFEENLKRFPAILDRKVKHMRKLELANTYSKRKLDDKLSTEGLSSCLNPDIQSAKESLSSISCIFIDEVFEKAFDCLLALILLIHNSDGLKPSSVSLVSTGKDSQFLNSNKEEFENVSKTLRALVRFLELYNSSFFTLLRNHHSLKGKMEHLISRFVLCYLRSVSVLHPLADQVKYQLLSDFATLEGFLSSLCPTWVTVYQNVYNCLRSFRMLLFSETESILDNTESVSSKNYLYCIYPSLLLHHLLSRWNISKIFVFERPDWTLKTYLYFWETHSERKICEMAIEHLQNCLPEISNTCSADDIKTLSKVPVFISKMLDMYESVEGTQSTAL
ncbi:hypothetical protein GpartN1_g5072.t1 [Galdieria partita]|uniref:Conserved oligomeric Golgi complex subunit 5 helical domain-containing protein n=1 Tax=Galdieria partita TaxID=83374 RepID=A0A9C7PZ71_9RHOD|nr:hypothetical protein GpartN1_g5072.t1 [Galdieria partita]